MNTGEHIMMDANFMDVMDDYILLYRDEEEPYENPIMMIYVKDLMAWEMIR